MYSDLFTNIAILTSLLFFFGQIFKEQDLTSKLSLQY